MFPINKELVPVTVEYDARGRRVTKTLTDADAARRFYAAKLRAGKQPKLLLPAPLEATDEELDAVIEALYGDS